MVFFEALFQGGQSKNLTSFFSFEYLALFLPIVLIIYTLTPAKFKKYTLLLFSYVFVWHVSGELLFVLLGSTIVTYMMGRYLEKLKAKHRELVKRESDKQVKKTLKAKLQKRRQRLLAVVILAHISLLVVFKYLLFLASGFNTLFVRLGVSIVWEAPKLIVPIGISFFTLQMIAYLVDVHRDTIQADKHFGRVALFFAFFPQIIEGPIVRYSQTAQQLWAVKAISYDNFVLGLQRILFGLFKKVVIADRLNVLIRIIFTKYMDFEGSMVVIGAIAYTIQLYMEFSGSLDAVIGIGQMFDVTLPENFRQPFASRTISEFWQRWHITLGTFFKDYVFYPLSMSKPLKNLTIKSRKRLGNVYGPVMVSGIALFVVWLFNGMWHGAGYHFWFFGFYHFCFILLETLFSPLSNRLAKKINTQSRWYRAIQRLRTLIIIVIGEMFFRAVTLDSGMKMFHHMVNQFTFQTYHVDLIKKLGIDYYDVAVVIVGVIIVTLISHFKEKGIVIREKIALLPIVPRWAFWYGVILVVIIFGAYGGRYVPVDPIYANF